MLLKGKYRQVTSLEDKIFIEFYEILFPAYIN